MAPWPLTKTKAIHKVVASGDTSKFKALVARKKVDVNAVNANGATALHNAAVLDDSDALKALLAHPDIDPNAQEPTGKTPLHLAISAGSLSAVEALLEHPRTDVNLADRDGRSPLHCAVNAILIRENAPDDTSDFSFLRFPRAAKRIAAAKSVAAAGLLARAPGLNYGAQDKRKRTPLSWALHFGLFDLAMAFIGDREVAPEVAVTDSEGNTALHKAVADANSESFVAVLLRGQDRAVLNARNNKSETALHIAARSDAYYSLKLLVEAGADLDVRRDWDGATPFHVAVQHRSHMCVDILERLRRTQHSITFAKDNDGNTPLHLAAEQGDSEMVRRILDLYADETSGSSPQPNSVNVAQVNNKGETAVGLAAARGYVDLTILLLERGSIESEADRSRCSEAALKILPHLFDTSTAESERDRRVHNLLSCAAKCGMLDVLQALQHHASPSELEDLVVLAAGAGHVHVVQYLVETGVDPNIRESSERIATPLAAAARHGHTEVMRFLLSLDRVDPNDGGNHHRASVDDGDDSPPGNNTPLAGDTPLMCAIRARSAAAVSLLLSDELLQSGRLDLNMGDEGSNKTRKPDYNPLLLTCLLDYDDMAKLLIRRTYFDRGWLTLHVSTNYAGMGPLHLACIHGHWRVAEVLLQARSWPSGLDALRVDAKDGFGRSPFSRACGSRSPETVKLFLESGLIGNGLIDPDSTDREGMTPLAHACEYGAVDVVELILDSYLLKDGLVNPNARDKRGQTPLAHACARGNWKKVELFLDYFLGDDPVGVVDFGTVDESGDTLLDLAGKVYNEKDKSRTILALLDNRLIDKGLVEPWKATRYISENVQDAYFNGCSGGVEESEMWPVVQRLAELGAPW